MIFGEVVLTDGCIAYLSSIWKGRYIIDVSSEWEKRDLFAFRCIYILFATLVYSSIIGVANNLCYTSYVGEENFLNPVLTQCPLVPELSDMLVVGADWLNATQP